MRCALYKARFRSSRRLDFRKFPNNVSSLRGRTSYSCRNFQRPRHMMGYSSGRRMQKLSISSYVSSPPRQQISLDPPSSRPGSEKTGAWTSGAKRYKLSFSELEKIVSAKERNSAGPKPWLKTTAAKPTETGSGFKCYCIELIVRVFHHIPHGCIIQELKEI